jgi:hypothetical protein
VEGLAAAAVVDIVGDAAGSYSSSRYLAEERTLAVAALYPEMQAVCTADRTSEGV